MIIELVEVYETLFHLEMREWGHGTVKGGLAKLARNVLRLTISIYAHEFSCPETRVTRLV